MEKTLIEVRNTVDQIAKPTVNGGDLARLDDLAHDIARISLDNFTGELLRKALNIAAAIVTFVDEWE